MEPAAFQLPTLYELQALPQWGAVEFISDLHLSEDQPATFDAWVAYLDRSDADAVLMLGDVFEVWVGDDSRHSGFEAMCRDVLSRAASRRQVGFMTGNRDFLVGAAMLRDCGLIALQDPTILCAWKHRVLLTHGDLLCLDDGEYQRYRRQVRSDEWREAFLARPLEERRAIARQMRQASEQHKQMQASSKWVDVDAAIAVAWLHAAGGRDLVHGHTHRPGSEEIAPGFMRHVLSDWDFDNGAQRGEVLRLTRDGFFRFPFVP